MTARENAISAVFCSVLSVAALSTAAAAGPELSQTDDTGVTYLTRGPLHEAYAAVATNDAAPGLTAPQRPPEPVAELPPEEKPEGEGYIWIPGYWSWDDELSEFIWISGVWRRPPPGKQWVPGYWAETRAGFQWVPGFWQAVEDKGQLALEYLPTPPPSLELGPNIPQPRDNDFWVPGYWVWHGSRYVWRPGYWGRFIDGWVWVPARYVWTPGGCIFIRGYWDHVFWQRGLCYAPVYFAPVVIVRPRLVYVPSVVLDLVALQLHLFCRPGYSHYYFGDYYDPRYRSHGIMPLYVYHSSRSGYDPLYVYNQWHFTQRQPDWEARTHNWYQYRAEHPEARPPHTLSATLALSTRRPDNATAVMRLARTANEAAADRAFPVRLTRLENDQRQRLADLGSDLEGFTHQRQELERKMGPRPETGTQTARRAELPHPGAGNTARQIADSDRARQGLPAGRGDPPGRQPPETRSLTPSDQRGPQPIAADNDRPRPNVSSERSPSLPEQFRFSDQLAGTRPTTTPRLTSEPISTRADATPDRSAGPERTISRELVRQPARLDSSSAISPRTTREPTTMRADVTPDRTSNPDRTISRELIRQATPPRSAAEPAVRTTREPPARQPEPQRPTGNQASVGRSAVGSFRPEPPPPEQRRVAGVERSEPPAPRATEIERREPPARPAPKVERSEPPARPAPKIERNELPAPRNTEASPRPDPEPRPASYSMKKTSEGTSASAGPSRRRK